MDRNTTTTFGYTIKTRFGIWNVRKLLEPTKLAQTSRIMKAYQLELLGLTEIRWPDHGTTPAPNGGILVHSGRPTGEPRMNGVGFVLS